MTDKQMKRIKDELDEKYYGNKPLFKENLKMPISKQDETIYQELSCRDMINSILIYGDNQCDENSYSFKNYLLPYTQKITYHKGLITLERLRELIKEQQESVAKAIVHKNVGCDSEGLMYNSITWEDEM